MGARSLDAEIEVKDGVVAAGQASIWMEMWDYDNASADDYIGGVCIDVSELNIGKPKPVALVDKEGKAMETELFVCLLPPSTKKKTVFFIRHGESTWNAAQDGTNEKGKIENLASMAESRDNPLSATGIKQVRALETKVKAAAADSEKATPGEKAFLGATSVWMSPLTRAVQTGLIGAQPVCK